MWFVFAICVHVSDKPCTQALVWSWLRSPDGVLSRPGDKAANLFHFAGPNIRFSWNEPSALFIVSHAQQKKQITIPKGDFSVFVCVFFNQSPLQLFVYDNPLIILQELEHFYCMRVHIFIVHAQ